jgi:hypothetical protein
VFPSLASALAKARLVGAHNGLSVVPATAVASARACAKVRAPRASAFALASAVTCKPGQRLSAMTHHEWCGCCWFHSG